MALLVITLAALVTALLATRLLVHAAPPQREPSIVPITRRPGEAPPIARVGGVAVFIAVVCALLAAAAAGTLGVDMIVQHGRLYAGIFAGATLILAAGLADDFLDLSPAVKLAAQGVAALLACAGGLTLGQVSFGPGVTISMGWLGIPLTLFWIVAVTNAFNFIDGLDGLAAGIGIVGFGATLLSALILGRSDALLVCAVVIAALLGFLRYNLAPARIYLGDSGSMFLGYLLAVLSLVGATSAQTGALIYVPFFALALPLLDGVVAISRRWLRQAPLWKGDHRHIHHRVQALGLSKRQSLAILIAAAVTFAGFGALMLFARPASFPIAAALAGVGAIVIAGFGIWRLDYYEFSALRIVLRVRPVSWRRFIREEIRIGDAEHEVTTARSLDELRSTLDRSALAFGMDRIEITRQQPRPRRAAQGQHHDVALAPSGPRGLDVWNLRVWHGQYDSPQESLVIRVADALGTVCAAWLHDVGVQMAVPSGPHGDGSAPLRGPLVFPRARRLLAKA